MNKINKYDFTNYRLICEYTWGNYILDKDWAVTHDLYKATKERLILQGIIK